MGKKIEAETDNIRVRKSVEASDPSTVIIAFRISSQRDEPVAIQLRDPLPAEHEIQVQAENTGEWTIDTESASYECVLEPDETATTGYKSTTPDDQALDIHTTTPVLDVTVPPEDNGGTAAEEPETFTRGASDAVFTFHGPERETPEHPTPTANTDAETPSSNTPGSDPTGPEKTDGPSATESARDANPDEALDSAEEFDAPGDEIGVADLVTDRSASTGSTLDQSQEVETELSDVEEESSNDDAHSSTDQSSEVVGEDVEIASPAEVQARIQRVDEAVLNEQPDRASPSLEARVQYLQSRFHDLAAYIDAMEVFIDEHGDGEHVLTALSTDLERVQEQLDRLDDQQTKFQTNLETIEDRLDTLDEREEAIDDDVYAFAESLERMEEVQQSVKEDVETLKAFHETLQNAI